MLFCTMHIHSCAHSLGHMGVNAETHNENEWLSNETKIIQVAMHILVVGFSDGQTNQLCVVNTYLTSLYGGMKIIFTMFPFSFQVKFSNAMGNVWPLC